MSKYIFRMTTGVLLLLFATAALQANSICKRSAAGITVYRGLVQVLQKMKKKADRANAQQKIAKKKNGKVKTDKKLKGDSKVKKESNKEKKPENKPEKKFASNHKEKPNHRKARRQIGNTPYRPGPGREQKTECVLQLKIFRIQNKCNFIIAPIPDTISIKPGSVSVLQSNKHNPQTPFQIPARDIYLHESAGKPDILYFLPKIDPDYPLVFEIRADGKPICTGLKYKGKDELVFKDNESSCMDMLRNQFVNPPPAPPEKGKKNNGLLYFLIPLPFLALLIWLVLNRFGKRPPAAKQQPAAQVAHSAKPEISDADRVVFTDSPPLPVAPPEDKGIPSGNYIQLAALHTLYKDTAVGDVYIDREVAKQVFDFVWESVKQKPAPEVGGFIMGIAKPGANHPAQSDLYINAFLKDEAPDFQNNVNIRFSNQMAGEELDYINRRPGEEKLGWLHTHPGHGVFLSPTDIGTHFRSFPRACQLALVIESYDDFKTGIFSYKTGAREMNTVIDNDTNQEYKSWKNFI